MSHPPSTPSSLVALWRALPPLFAMRNDHEPPGRPRQESINHLSGVIATKAEGAPLTVAECALASIEGIKTVFGERGGRSVNDVFTDPELQEALRQPATDREAMYRVIRAERQYWQAQDQERSTPGSRAGAEISEEDRYALMLAMGRVSEGTDAFSTGFRDSMDPGG